MRWICLTRASVENRLKKRQLWGVDGSENEDIFVKHGEIASNSAANVEAAYLRRNEGK